MTPRVLAMLHLPPPIHGVALKHQRMLEGAVGRSVDLRVIRYRFARDTADLGRRSVRKLALAWWYLVRQVHEVIGRRPDAGYLTLTTTADGLLRDAVYMQVFRTLRTPYLVHVPTLGLAAELDRVGRARAWFVRRALRGAWAVIVLNDIQRDELRAVVPAARLRVVRNALPDLPAAERRAAGPRQVKTVLFLSNMIPSKGPFLLLEAVPGLREAAVRLEVVFAGGWPDEATRRRFTARVEELGVADLVRTVGSVAEDQKRELLCRADVLAFPSHYPPECSPNVVIEGMRHGLAIVAARHAGIPELLEDGQSGILVAPGEVAPLQAAVKRLLTDQQLALRLGAHARAAYERRHRQERWDHEITGLLHEAAGLPFTPAGSGVPMLLTRRV